MNSSSPRPNNPGTASAITNSSMVRKANARFFPSTEPLPTIALPQRDAPSPPIAKTNSKGPAAFERAASSSFTRPDTASFGAANVAAPSFGLQQHAYQGPVLPVQSSSGPGAAAGFDGAPNLRTLVLEEMIDRRDQNAKSIIGPASNFQQSSTRQNRQNVNPFGQNTVDEQDRWPTAPSTPQAVPFAARPDVTEDITSLKRMTRENVENLARLSVQLDSMASQNRSIMESVSALKSEVEALRRTRAPTGPDAPRSGFPAVDMAGSSDYARLREEVDFKTRRIAELQEKVNELNHELASHNIRTRTEYNLVLDEKNRKIHDLMATDNTRDPLRERPQSYFNDWVQTMRDKEDQLAHYRHQLHKASLENEARLNHLNGHVPRHSAPHSYAATTVVDPHGRDIIMNRHVNPITRTYQRDYSPDPVTNTHNHHHRRHRHHHHNRSNSRDAPKQQVTEHTTIATHPTYTTAVPTYFDAPKTVVTTDTTNFYNAPRVSTTYSQRFLPSPSPVVSREEVYLPSTYVASTPLYSYPLRTNEYGDTFDAYRYTAPRTFVGSTLPWTTLPSYTHSFASTPSFARPAEQVTYYSPAVQTTPYSRLSSAPYNRTLYPAATTTTTTTEILPSRFLNAAPVPARPSSLATVIRRSP